jgi:hypothetical protein
MIIYLYVKTHNKTGLKYLGKTTSKDPYKYPGSGIRWKNHLKIYGHDYNTEILQLCQSEDELKDWGLYYSNLWNIVESKEWANLKTEQGQGGAGFVVPEETKRKMIETRTKNGTLNTNSPKSIAKGLETRKKNNTLNTTTPASIAKRVETRKLRDNLNKKGCEAVKKQWETKQVRDPDNLSGKKTRETRIKNGTDKGWKRSPESNARMIETRKRKMAAKVLPPS